MPRPKPTYAASSDPAPDEPAEKITFGSSSGEIKIKSSPETDGKNLVEKMNDFGQSLKPKALEKMRQGSGENDKWKRLGLSAQSCILWALFLVYRAYRGFFVLLPAVFRETYRKLQYSLDSPFTDEPGTQDVNPETGKLRLRTRLTISVLSFMVTMTYVVGGTVNVLMKFFKMAFSSTSGPKSFEAAADEAELYENKILKMTAKESINGTSLSDKSNGTTSGLSP